jgi:hypothetical protein
MGRKSGSLDRRRRVVASKVRLRFGLLNGETSFVDVAIFHFLLLAFVKAFHDRRAPWYQRGLIRKPLRKIGVILLHYVEQRFRGKLAMVLGK